MSMKRIFRWMCDKCLRVAEIEHYGGPNGWKWAGKTTAKGSGEVVHFCALCVEFGEEQGFIKPDKEDPKRFHFANP